MAIGHRHDLNLHLARMEDRSYIDPERPAQTNPGDRP
jgi:hypothetical protein